jgi:hypothetical protein
MGGIVILDQIAQGLRKQDWFTAILELIILVVGIYIGLQVDDWVSERKDRQTETIYLELLARDVAVLQQQVGAQLAFEKDKVNTATRAYELLTSDDPSAHQVELGELLTALSDRRTLSLVSATYEQMVSSGHLQLIRNRNLRDKLVRYFALMKRDEAIIGKNNQDLIDDIYVPFLLQAGISLRLSQHDTEAVLNRAWAIMAARLGPDNELPPDVVLSRSPEAESWSDIRRNVIFRLRIATVGQAKNEDIASYMQEIADDLAAELDNRKVEKAETGLAVNGRS